MRRPVDNLSRVCAAASASLLLTTLMLLAASAARAEFTPATLLSGTSRLQFDNASSPAFSQNGGYVAFRGTLAGVPGIYRRGPYGEIALVAGEASAGASEAERLLSAPDASAPSISEEGRYVAFTSAAVLDPQEEGPGQEDGKGCPQVYVRDMDLAPSAPGAYTLASAVDGGSEGLTYEKRCTDGSSTALSIGGAQAAAGVALSANGKEVAFTVLSPSDLGGPCTGAPLKCPTEASQVAVRDLEKHTTTLVSVTPAGQPTPGGGAFPSTASEATSSMSGSSVSVESGEPSASSVAISANGSTVAWEGTDVPAQVSSATEVTAGMAKLGGAGYEIEPLWRRVADGPSAVTRRLLAGAGLNFFFFNRTNLSESEQPVRGGAIGLEPPGQADFVPPVLDAEGETVVAIANAPTPENEGSYSFLGGIGLVPPAEAYAVQIDDDPATPPLITPLTATPDFAALGAIYGGISDVAISPDGSRMAFNTRRVSFAPAALTLVSPPAQEVGYAYTYVANLRLGTLQRVTSTYEGAPPNGEPGKLSLSGDGLSLAFASSAANLFYGDVAPGASQVYLSQEVPSPNLLAVQSESPPPLEALPTPAWVLSAIAAPQPDGSVLIDAYVPGAGKLTVRAGAQLLSRATSKRQQAKNGRRKARVSGASSSVQVPTRTVGQATAVARGSSELHLRLRVNEAYGALVAGKDGLYCVLQVSFTDPGHAALRQEIPVTLRRTLRAKPGKGNAHKGSLTRKSSPGKPESPGKTGVAQ
jgi:hypothetical protein